MQVLIADTETDGLLHQLTKVHCIVIRYAKTGKLLGSFADQPGYRPLREAVDILLKADCVVGHNWLQFDIPALEKVYGVRFDRKKARDTLILARVLWPDVKAGDFLRVKKGTFPSKLLKRPHSLKAWGYRLRVYKGDFGETSDWKTWSKEMQDYCEQDTTVTLALWNRIAAKDLDPRCVELEHDVADLCTRITANGFPFNREKAASLLATIQKDKAEVTRQLKEAFPPIERVSLFIPKRDNKPKGYKKGVPIERVKVVEFDPASRQQIAERLMAKGWKPSAYTHKGQVKIDEPILESLPYPEAKLLLDYLLLEKREASLTGKQGWLVLERDGKIHGEYNTAGAITGRPTHVNPNISQVTKECPKYGHVFRELFGVPPGWCLVGADFSGLELRCLSHFLAPFDDGAYAEVVAHGDVHTTNQHAAGLASRGQAKTFIYAFLYGAGGWKLGHIVDPLVDDDAKTTAGNKLKTRFLKNTPGLQKLRNAVAGTVDEYGDLIGLDGRPLTIRKKHAALNTLLQSAGALLCKRWIVSVERELCSRGLSHGWEGDFAIVAWVHDELQIACRTPEIAEIVKDVAIAETARAGEFFGFRCPLTGEAKIGATWAATH